MKKAVVIGYMYLTRRYLIRFTKMIMRLPVEIRGRKYLKYLIGASDSNLKIDKQSGYTRFDIRKIPEMNAVFIKLQKLAKEWLNDAESRRSEGLLIDLMLPSDLLEHPDINMPNFRYRQGSTFNIMKKIKKLGHYIRNDDKTMKRKFQKFPVLSEDDFQTPINMWMEAGVLNRIPELQRIDKRLWVVS